MRLSHIYINVAVVACHPHIVKHFSFIYVLSLKGFVTADDSQVRNSVERTWRVRPGKACDAFTFPLLYQQLLWPWVLQDGYKVLTKYLENSKRHNSHVHACSDFLGIPLDQEIRTECSSGLGSGHQLCQFISNSKNVRQLCRAVATNSARLQEKSEPAALHNSDVQGEEGQRAQFDLSPIYDVISSCVQIIPSADAAKCRRSLVALHKCQGAKMISEEQKR